MEVPHPGMAPILFPPLFPRALALKAPLPKLAAAFFLLPIPAHLKLILRLIIGGRIVPGAGEYIRH